MTTTTPTTTTPPPPAPTPAKPSFWQRLAAITNIPISQATAVAGLISTVGLIVGVVPKWAPYKAALIAGIPGFVSAVWWIANAIHTYAASNPTLADVTAIVQEQVNSAVASLNLPQIAATAVDAQGLEQIVKERVAAQFEAVAEAAQAAVTPDVTAPTTRARRRTRLPRLDNDPQA